MTITITPEYVMNLGEEVKRVVLEMSTPEERIAGMASNDVLPHFSFEEIEAYLEEHRPKPTGKEKTDE